MTKICIAPEQLDEIDEPILHIQEIQTSLFTLADAADGHKIGDSLFVIVRALRHEIGRIHGWKEVIDKIIDGERPAEKGVS